FHGAGFGEFDRQAAGDVRIGGQDVAETREEIGVLQSRSGHVHRQTHGRLLLELFQRKFQHTLVDPPDKAGFFRGGKQGGGRNQRAVAPAQSHQRLVEGGSAAGGVNQRLKGDDDAIVLER